MLPWPIYEGDGLIHDPPRSAAAGRASVRCPHVTANLRTKAPPASSVSNVRGRSSELAEKRGEALRRFFPKLFSWVANQAQMAQMRDVERYLSRATDVFDLERRIQRLERQRCGPL